MNPQPDNSSSTLSAPFPWQVSQWQRVNTAFNSTQLAHSYLFSGEKGLGKFLFAQAFANFMLCLSPADDKNNSSAYRRACGQCTNCRKGGSTAHPDIFRIEPEEGSKNIKIEQIRALSEFVIRSSHSGGAKVVLIQDAHLLNRNAANALLKTLEEPNNNTYLFLISDLPGKLMATIRSRCQKLHFAAPENEQASNWLRGVLGDGNIDALLSASSNCPLVALQLAEGDSLQLQRQFVQCLCDIKQGRASIQSALAVAARIGEAEVLQHFAAFLTTLTRYSLTGLNAEAEGSAIQNLLALSNPIEDREASQSRGIALLNFYAEVETARRQLSSSTNPNPQLIMESLLWRWSKLALNAATA